MAGIQTGLTDAQLLASQLKAHELVGQDLATQADLDALALSTGNLTESQVATVDNLSGLTASGEDINALVEDSYEVVSEIVKVGNTDGKNGTFTSTITGWRFPISYDGYSFDIIEIYVNPESSSDVVVEIFDTVSNGSSDVILASATKHITSSGLHSFTLNKMLKASDFTDGIAWIGYRTNNATSIRMSGGNCVLAADYPATATTNKEYLTISANSGSWTAVTTGRKIAYTTECKLINSQSKLFKADIIADNIKELESQIIVNEIVEYPAFYDCEGIESHIYFNNLSPLDDAYDFDINSSYTIGRQQSERWTKFDKNLTLVDFSPTTGYETYITAKVKNTNKIVSNFTMKHHIALATHGAGKTPIVNCIGDSTTEAGSYTLRLLNIAATDAMKISLIGTKGSSSNFHEGWGGKTALWFATNEDSPLVFNGVLDYAQYISSNGFATPDFVYLHLGINDVFGATDDATASLSAVNSANNIQLIIDSIHSFNSTIKVVVNTCIMPNASQDGFGSNYGIGVNRKRYKRNICMHNQNLINTFNNRSAENIYLNCGFSLQLDPVYGYYQKLDDTTYYNSASELVTEHNNVYITRPNNGVHPFFGGYYMMGDALWSHLKWMNK